MGNKCLTIDPRPPRTPKAATISLPRSFAALTTPPNNNVVVLSNQGLQCYHLPPRESRTQIPWSKRQESKKYSLPFVSPPIRRYLVGLFPFRIQWVGAWNVLILCCMVTTIVSLKGVWRPNDALMKLYVMHYWCIINSPLCANLSLNYHFAILGFWVNFNG
jgi:hypothetical protein